MHDAPEIDPGLFGLWPKQAGYDGLQPAGDALAVYQPAIEQIVLETKSGDEPEPDLRVLLNQLTRELSEQFRAFRTLRTQAETLLATSVDDGEIKLAKADIKAATDAISLIVRTLEKVDSLQRSLANDRAQDAERNIDTAAYDAARQQLLDLIDARAEERARALFAGWKAEWESGIRDGPSGSEAGGEITADRAAVDGGEQSQAG